MINENLPSRQYKRENNLFPDVYQYDEFPKKLKITLRRIFDRAFEYYNYPQQTERINFICTTICEEHSLLNLNTYRDSHASTKEELYAYFLNIDDTYISLDILYLFCLIFYQSKSIREINQRMLEHGFGYQFEEGILIRIDSKHTHKELVVPALKLLRDDRFKNANEEYRKAFDAFKRGDYDSVFIESYKAFESTMKIICEINNFDYKKKGTASDLIETLKQKNFIKGYNTNMLKGLGKLLQSVPTLRNNDGGHGSGTKSENEKLPLSYVNLSIHQTAACILFLMERQTEFEKEGK